MSRTPLPCKPATPLDRYERRNMPHENHPVANNSHHLSRRRFIASAGILTAAAWLSPQHLLAEGENIVVAARKRAETANITVQALRGNVSALIGSGGHIAVLAGRDGKVIIDSGYATSRARITDALAKIDLGPINRIRRARQSSRMRTLENIFPQPRAWKVGTSPSRRRPRARFPP